MVDVSLVIKEELLQLIRANKIQIKDGCHERRGCKIKQNRIWKMLDPEKVLHSTTGLRKQRLGVLKHFCYALLEESDKTRINNIKSKGLSRKR